MKTLFVPDIIAFTFGITGRIGVEWILTGVGIYFLYRAIRSLKKKQ